MRLALDREPGDVELSHQRRLIDERVVLGAVNTIGSTVLSRPLAIFQPPGTWNRTTLGLDR